MITANPTLTAPARRADRQDRRQPARRGLLRGARAAAQARHPVPVHRPPGARHRGARRGRRDREPRLRRASTPSATRSGPTPPRTSPRTCSASWAPRASRLAGFELIFDDLLSGKDGSATYEMGGGQPAPARRQQRRGAGERLRPPADHRPRRAVVHPARAARGRPGLRRRVRRRGRARHPHRGDCSRSPTTRPSTPTSRRSPRRPTSAPGRSPTSTSPARWRRCSPPPRCSTPARSPRRPGSRCPRELPRAGPRDPRLLRPRHAAAHPDRRDRQVLQHRHRARRRQFAPGRAARLPAPLRARAAAPASGMPGESPGLLPAWDGLVADQPGHHRLRPGRLGQRASRWPPRSTRSPTAASTCSPAW